LIKVGDLLRGREEAKVSLLKKEPFLFIACTKEKIPLVSNLKKITEKDIWYLGTDGYVPVPSHIRYLFAGGAKESLAPRVQRRLLECSNIGPHILIFVNMVSSEVAQEEIYQAYAGVCRGETVCRVGNTLATTSEYLLIHSGDFQW
jgi:hypothetical protein